MAPLIVQTEHLHPEAVAWLEGRCRVVRARPGEGAFEDTIGAAEGLVVRTYTRVDADLLIRAPRLRVVGRAGVGLDNIDVRACAERGVIVVYTPDANTGAVAEYVFALLLGALRPITRLRRAVGSTEWGDLRRAHVARRQLADLCLGIYGFGRVGSAVARAAGGFGMDVLYHDILDIPASARGGAVPVSRAHLLERCDVISVHVDGRAANRGLIGADAFARMKDEAVFVNTSRGFVVDPDALAAWLRHHPDARALIDVHEPEPFEAGCPLLALDNAHLFPHLGAATATADRRMSMVVEDVWRVLQGQPARHPATVLP